MTGDKSEFPRFWYQIYIEYGIIVMALSLDEEYHMKGSWSVHMRPCHIYPN